MGPPHMSYPLEKKSRAERIPYAQIIFSRSYLAAFVVYGFSDFRRKQGRSRQ